MSEPSGPKVCGRCLDTLCPMLRHDGLSSWAGLKSTLVSDSRIRRDLELCNSNRLIAETKRVADALDRLADCIVQPDGWVWLSMDKGGDSAWSDATRELYGLLPNLQRHRRDRWMSRHALPRLPSSGGKP